MPADSHAVLEDHDGRTALRFERVLAHSPERVWRALTRNDELFDWHPTPFDLEPHAGGRVSYRPTPRSARDARGEGARVRAAAPARLQLGRG